MKIHRRIIASVLVVLLLAVQTVPAIPASAFTEPDEAPIDKQIQRIWGYAFLYCATGGFQSGWDDFASNGWPGEALQNSISVERAEKSDLWDVGDKPDVGHEIDPEDGKVGCKDTDERAQIIDNTAKLLGVSGANGLIKQYWTLDGDEWKLNDGPSGSRVRESQLFTDLINALRNNSYEGGDGRESRVLPGPTERKRRTLVAVARCIAPIGNGTGAPLKIDEKEYAFKNGKEYRWRKGKDGGSRIAVGRDWQINGDMRCDTLVKVADNEDFLTDDVDLNALWENPQLLAEQAGANGEGVIGGAFGTVSGGDNAPTCESETSNDLAWLMCAGLGLIDDTFASMQGYVDEMLDVSENEFDSPELKAVWSYFKNVATFLLILIGLVMIIGQAVSRE